MPVAWIEDAKTGETRTIDAIMRDVLIFVYGKHGTVRAAADALGVSRSTFAAWCDHLDVKIERPGRRGARFTINLKKLRQRAA